MHPILFLSSFVLFFYCLQEILTLLYLFGRQQYVRRQRQKARRRQRQRQTRQLPTTSSLPTQTNKHNNNDPGKQ